MIIQISGEREKRVELYDALVILGLPVQHGPIPEFPLAPETDLFVVVPDEPRQAFMEELIIESGCRCVVHP